MITISAALYRKYKGRTRGYIIARAEEEAAKRKAACKAARAKAKKRK